MTKKKRLEAEHIEINELLTDMMRGLTFFKHILPQITEQELRTWVFQEVLLDAWNVVEQLKATIQDEKTALYEKFKTMEDTELGA